ncbi:hypothetical protein ACW9UR_04870 [Halovulum sp. GXIMD14794]
MILYCPPQAQTVAGLCQALADELDGAIAPRTVKIAPQFIFNNAVSLELGTVADDRLEGRLVWVDRAGRTVTGEWVETSVLDGDVNAGAVARFARGVVRASGPALPPPSKK